MLRAIAAHHRRLSTAARLRPFLIERFEGWFDGSLSLSSSECEPISLRDLLSHADDAQRERWEALSLGYTDPSEGSSFLREAIAAHYETLGPGSINVCAPQEGIFLAVSALCHPGDHVVATTPCYQSLTEVARAIGCEVSSWRPEGLEAGRSVRFEPSTLAALLRPNTRAVICNFPHK